jgi:hypothetical protein
MSKIIVGIYVIHTYMCVDNQQLDLELVFCQII